MLFGERNRSTAAELGILNLGAAGRRRAEQMQSSKPPQHQAPSPRRAVSAPAAIDYGVHAGYSDFLLAPDGAADFDASHQHPVPHEQLGRLFGQEYDENHDDHNGDEFDEDDLDEYLIDIGSRRRRSSD